MRLESTKGRWKKTPAPFFIFLNIVCCLFVKDVIHAETVQKLSLSQLAQRADVIVQGRVQRVNSKESPDRSGITTFVEVSVSEQWKGRKESTVTFSQPGGSTGGITQAVRGLAHFSMGEEVILFLKEADSGRFLIVGGKQGKFVVKTDSQSKKQFAEDLTGNSYPLNDFLIRLRSVVK